MFSESMPLCYIIIIIINVVGSIRVLPYEIGRTHFDL